MEQDILRNRTKIVCTIGPASSAQGTLREMIEAGMDVARINFSHGDVGSNIELLEKIRLAADEAGRPVAIMQDLQGPKIRVGELPRAGLELIEGQMAILQAGIVEADKGIIPVPYERLAADLKRGDRILLDDGTKELEVLGIEGRKIQAKVLLGGHLISHKGINVPTRTLSAEAMTKKDEEDLMFGLKQNIDFVALSFVKTAQDVRTLRQKINQHLPKDVDPPAVIAKIEKHEALQHFDEILEETDGVMVARGDLGLETPATRVPVLQKELIAKCIVAGKPVITATEMLASMETNPRPTRAEVSDVANAVIDHSDAMMLSGETAMGRFPVRAVKTMADIVADTEESPLDNLLPHKDASGEPVPSAMAAAAVELARHIEARAILVTTRSGYSARAAARFRPEVPVFAATDNPRVCRQLQVTWGVTPFLAEGYKMPQQMAVSALQEMRQMHKLKSGDKVVVVSGLRREEGGYDSSVRVVEL